MLIDFKDEDFESKIKNEEVSVIQFSAAWCGPCKALKQIKLLSNCLISSSNVFGFTSNDWNSIPKKVRDFLTSLDVEIEISCSSLLPPSKTKIFEFFIISLSNDFNLPF